MTGPCAGAVPEPRPSIPVLQAKFPRKLIRGNYVEKCKFNMKEVSVDLKTFLRL